jgi:hypothetical protein
MTVVNLEKSTKKNSQELPAGIDLVEYYFERGFTDGLPVVPPTQAKIDQIVNILGGDPEFVEARVAPRWGDLSREVLAINMVMAGCKPEYAPVVRAAIHALTDQAFNLNGVQATTHVASPLLIVNGPIAEEIGDPYGFFSGLWHGYIIVFSFFGWLFVDGVFIIGQPNTGLFYYIGFGLGVMSFFGSANR